MRKLKDIRKDREKLLKLKESLKDDVIEVSKVKVALIPNKRMIKTLKSGTNKYNVNRRIWNKE